MGKKFPTEIVLTSAEMFTEIGLSTEMRLLRGPGNFVENVPDVHRGFSLSIWIYKEGCDGGDGCPTRAPLYLGLHQRVSGLCARECIRASVACFSAAMFYWPFLRIKQMTS